MTSRTDTGDRNQDFEAAAEAAYPALGRAATILCWSRSDVEDVVQETMLRAFKAYGSFRGDSSFLTWAYAILARVAQAANRRHVNRLPSDLANDQPLPLPPVDRAVVAEEDARCLIDAIRSLPDRQREMVTLHFLEHFRYAEIADALGVSVGTVKATLFEAKVSLRRALARKGLGRKELYVLP